MANFLIDQIDVLKSLNNLMGRRQLPGGEQEDLKRYCQEAFNYAWRYYKWRWSLRRATVDLSSDGFLPTDFDLDGYHKVAAAPGEQWVYVPVEEYDSLYTGNRYYTLEFDPTSNRYKFVTSFAVASVPIIYQMEPPILKSDGAKVPFPSSMVIGEGAAVWAKQGENPTRADVSQEWDIFHDSLDRLVAQSDKNAPRQLRRTRQDVAGTFTGDVGD